MIFDLIFTTLFHSMRNRIILYILFVFSTFTVSWAQAPHACNNPHCPTRTSEDEARKMTEMMVRDLGLSDSVQITRIYELNLRVAIERKGQTEAPTAEQHQARMTRFMSQLKTILTAEQYERFMTICRSREPRHPQATAITH